jgi:hypothetical protein
MITKEEFLKALEIVNNYKAQVLEQFQEMKKELDNNNFSNLLITKDTPLRETGISVKAIEALIAYATYEIEEAKGLRCSWHDCQLKVGHFENFKRSDLLKLRNIGVKTLVEIEKVFLQAGIILVN